MAFLFKDFYFSVGPRSIRFRAYFSNFLLSNTFVYIEEQSAFLVDPHPDEEVIRYLTNCGVKTVDVFLTHEHADHTYGLPSLIQHFNVRVFCSKTCSEVLAYSNYKPLRTLRLLVEWQNISRKNEVLEIDDFLKNYEFFSYDSSIAFDQETSLFWRSHSIRIQPTPGHSPGSICLLFDDKILFSGDSLLKIYPVITRLPGGNTKEYKKLTETFFQSLEKDVVVLPGHGEPFNIREFY